MEIKIDRGLIKALEKASKTDGIKKAVQLNASELQRKAQRRAPVDTGFLRRSITLDFKDSGMTASIKPTAEYAPYVEYGTRFMSAQPFIRPSFYEQEKKFIKDIEKLMK